MGSQSDWAIIRDSNGGLELKPYKESMDNELIEKFDSFSEAKLAFNFYCYLLISKFGQNMNF